MIRLTLITSRDDVKLKQWSLTPINNYRSILKQLWVVRHFHGGVEGDRSVAGIRNWFKVGDGAWFLLDNLSFHIFVGVKNLSRVTFELKIQIVLGVCPFTVGYFNFNGFVGWHGTVLDLFDLTSCFIENHIWGACEVNCCDDCIFFKIYWLWNLEHEIGSSTSPTLLNDKSLSEIWKSWRRIQQAAEVRLGYCFNSKGELGELRSVVIAWVSLRDDQTVFTCFFNISWIYFNLAIRNADRCPWRFG